MDSEDKILRYMEEKKYLSGKGSVDYSKDPMFGMGYIKAANEKYQVILKDSGKEDEDHDFPRLDDITVTLAGSVGSQHSIKDYMSLMLAEQIAKMYGIDCNISLSHLLKFRKTASTKEEVDNLIEAVRLYDQKVYSKKFGQMAQRMEKELAETMAFFAYEGLRHK